MAARGRPKGSPNKSKQALIGLLQDRYPGYQPVLKMADAAMEISALAEQAKNDADLWSAAVAAHDKVARYTTPQLKAVEHSMDPNDPLTVQIVHHADDPSATEQWLEDCVNGDKKDQPNKTP